jgi:ABC-type branched-subunit amino acid transport system ATPase component
MALLELRGVSLAFAGSVVLSQVDFDVPASKIVSLIGPNGAGKTSLFNCITGFYRPQQGSIRFDGRETLRMKPHQVTSVGIARTFQNVRLFREMTVLENVMSGQHCRTSAGVIGAILGLPSQRREEREIAAFSEECLRFVGITEYWDREATTLPYGWQRRVEIARALATKPRFLLLDEPAAGLTASEKEELIGLIRRIRDERDICILLIEHDTGLVRARAGKVSFGGTDITQASAHDIARMGVVHVPEGRHVLRGLSVRENLELGGFTVPDAKLRSQRLEEVFAQFPILKTRANSDGSLLSGGEQQMLAVGRALMHGPKILLLDEPSMGLAPKLVLETMKIVKRLNESGTTILLVEQNARLALKLAHYGYVLESGTIKLKGEASKLREDASIVEAYLGT